MKRDGAEAGRRDAVDEIPAGTGSCSPTASNMTTGHRLSRQTCVVQETKNIVVIGKQ